MTAPALRQGGAQAEEAAAQSGGKFVKLNYFNLDENKSGVYRFITDSPQWFYVKQHPSVPTKNKPADFKGNWPQGMPAVCRHDEAFASMYTDCYVCDTPVMSPHDPTKALKPAVRVWALAVEREAVVKDGIVQGYKTVMEEVPARDEHGQLIENKTVRQPKVVVVNMGMKNFFSGLQGIYGLYNSVCDRDMSIRRTGSGIATDYQIIPLDKLDDAVPGTPTFDKWLKAVEDQGIDLATIIADRASDEYFARFFDPSKSVAAPVPAPGTGASTSAIAQAAAASQSAPAEQAAVVDQDRLAAMAARVTGTGANAGAAAPAAAPEAPAEAPAPAAAPEAPAAKTGPVNFDE